MTHADVAISGTGFRELNEPGMFARFQERLLDRELNRQRRRAGDLGRWWAGKPYLLVAIGNLRAGKRLVALLHASPRPLDRTQRRVARMFVAERTADELAFVVDVDLGRVARVIERLDLLADEGRERGLDVAPAHQANAVAEDLAGLGYMNEQHVELFEAVRHGRQEPALLPSRDRRLPGAAMRAAVVDAAHEHLEPHLQLVEGECWRRQRLARNQVAGQVRQEHVVDGAEQALDLAASAGAARQGMNEGRILRAMHACSICSEMKSEPLST